VFLATVQRWAEAAPALGLSEKAMVSNKVYFDINCGGSSPGSAYKYGTFWMNQVKESWRACRSPRTISIPQSARCLEKCRLPFPEREEEQELCAAIRSGRGVCGSGRWDALLWGTKTPRWRDRWRFVRPYTFRISPLQGLDLRAANLRQREVPVADRQWQWQWQ
jgi:hypothetical protein